MSMQNKVCKNKKFKKNKKSNFIFVFSSVPVRTEYPPMVRMQNNVCKNKSSEKNKKSNFFLCLRVYN